jgi:uncharacterized protein involved in exopolysaccharide biosynthesis
MKRTMRFLARLYPSRWRKRYGAELDALLEDATPSARDAFDVFCGALKMQMTTWSFGRIMLACSLVGILVAAAVSFAVPVHYLSQAVFTATPASEFTLDTLKDLTRNISSRESLNPVIQEHNLYARERARMSLDDVIDKMKQDITVETLPLASPRNRDRLTFVVQFDYPDAHVAQQVNAELASRFIEGNVDPRLNSHATLQLPGPPSLPLRPTAPNRMELAALGLLAGLLAGLTITIILRSCRTTTVGNG